MKNYFLYFLVFIIALSVIMSACQAIIGPDNQLSEREREMAFATTVPTRDMTHFKQVASPTPEPTQVAPTIAPTVEPTTIPPTVEPTVLPSLADEGIVDFAIIGGHTVEGTVVAMPMQVMFADDDVAKVIGCISPDTPFGVWQTNKTYHILRDANDAALMLTGDFFINWTTPETPACQAFATQVANASQYQDLSDLRVIEVTYLNEMDESSPLIDILPADKQEVFGKG